MDNEGFRSSRRRYYRTKARLPRQTIHSRRIKQLKRTLTFMRASIEVLNKTHSESIASVNKPNQSESFDKVVSGETALDMDTTVHGTLDVPQDPIEAATNRSDIGEPSLFQGSGISA